MAELIEMTGSTWGRLTVVSRAPSRSGRAYWHCRCECGGESVVGGKALRSGATQSCGCLLAERSAAWMASPEFMAHRVRGSTRHGHKRAGKASLEYKTWLGMKRRCNDPKCKDFPKWGGRGIRVCERWNKSFEAFLADMGERPSLRHQIDRKDSDGDYSPSNCRWVTPTTQGAENRRNLLPVKIGELAFPSISAACRHFGQPKNRVHLRMVAGYSLEEALTAPTRRLSRKRSRESYLPRNHPDRS